ncbi:MAG: hypothetical protein ACRERE_03675 [Candidatus Entotheonellia bacterium]
MDSLIVWMPASPYHQVATSASQEELSLKIFLHHLPEVSHGMALRPIYDEASLEWLFAILARKEALGSFRKVVVRNAEHEVLGWYLYYLNPGGVSEVVQIAGRATAIGDIFDHLCYDAWRQGALALAGQNDPGHMHEISRKFCIFTQAGCWLLVHSWHPELLEALHRSNMFLTRLESE